MSEKKGLKYLHFFGYLIKALQIGKLKSSLREKFANNFEYCIQSKHEIETCDSTDHFIKG